MGLNDGLVALYHFSGDATDSSGNGNNGTVNGATLTTDKNSVSNQAYSFDGVNDYMAINNVDVSNSDFSISGWFMADVLDITSPIFEDYLSENDRNMLYLNTNGELIAYNVHGGTYESVTATGLTNSTWYFFTYIRSGTTFYLYLNGVEIGSDSYINPSNTNNFYVGKRGYNSAYFDGKIDEVRIYNRALSDYEVLQLYVGYDTDADSVTATETIGLEAYYKLDGDATDSSGNGNTLYNVSGLTYNTGLINNGGLWNGTSTIAEVPDFIDSGGTNNFTINWWIKYTYGGYMVFMDRNDVSTAFQRFAIIMNHNSVSEITGTFYIFSRNASGTIGSLMPAINPNLNDGNWHMITFSRNTTSTTASKLYIDGNEIATTGSIVTEDIHVTGGHRIGRFYSVTTPYWLNALVDEIGIWKDRNLTPTEITELYNAGAGLSYPFTISTGYSNKVNGIIFSKINGIETANISKINGV